MERRCELRQAANGKVELELETSRPRVIVGELVETSISGFRVRHEDMELVTGDKVRYTHPGGTGAAMVMWTRVYQGWVETGLYTGPS